MTGAEQTPQERLDELICGWGIKGITPGYATIFAAAILDSDVIREMRQQDRREAWAIGVEARRYDRNPVNPYDQAATQ